MIELVQGVAPTKEAYASLQEAFDYFNQQLFEGRLAQPLLTLARKKRTFGYLSRDRFIAEDGRRSSELAMNPSYFGSRPIEDTLSTLVHEQVHLWQAQFGDPGRAKYHNSEWADKMKEIGLQPSSTGAPGGKEVGDHVSHYIIEDGAFQMACHAYLQTSVGITWFDVYVEDPNSKEGDDDIVMVTNPSDLKMVVVPPSPPAEPNNLLPNWETSTEAPEGAALPTQQIQIQPSVERSSPKRATHKSAPPTVRVNGLMAASAAIRATAKPTKPSRDKFTCPSCSVSAWGKYELHLICGACNQRMLSSSGVADEPE